MSSVLRRFSFLLATLAFFSMAGGQWTVLQGVAWARMLADYSQRSGSLVTGVEQTFDGRHACDLCRAIQVGKSKEHKESSTVSGAKEDRKVKALPTKAPAPCAERVMIAVVFPRGDEWVFTSWVEAPPTPPPRGAFFAA